MSEEKIVELASKRIIVQIPSKTKKLSIEATVLNEDDSTYKVQREVEVVEILKGFIKCFEGYSRLDDDNFWGPEPSYRFIVLDIPENSVAISLTYVAEDNKDENIRLAGTELFEALKEAEDYYTDDDDIFVLTPSEKRRLGLQEKENYDEQFS